MFSQNALNDPVCVSAVSVFTIMHTVKVCSSQHKTCNWANHSSGKFYIQRQLVCFVPITLMLLNQITGSAAVPYIVQGWPTFGPPEKYIRPLVIQIVPVIQLNKHNITGLQNITGNFISTE